MANAPNTTQELNAQVFGLIVRRMDNGGAVNVTTAYNTVWHTDSSRFKMAGDGIQVKSVRRWLCVGQSQIDNWASRFDLPTSIDIAMADAPTLDELSVMFAADLANA